MGEWANNIIKGALAQRGTQGEHLRDFQNHFVWIDDAYGQESHLAVGAWRSLAFFLVRPPRDHGLGESDSLDRCFYNVSQCSEGEVGMDDDAVGSMDCGPRHIELEHHVPVPCVAALTCDHGLAKPCSRGTVRESQFPYVRVLLLQAFPVVSGKEVVHHQVVQND